MPCGRRRIAAEHHPEQVRWDGSCGRRRTCAGRHRWPACGVTEWLCRPTRAGVVAWGLTLPPKRAASAAAPRAKTEAAAFLRIGRGDDRRAGDLRQLPPLPLWRRLVAVGRGDDAGGQISVPCLDRVCGACDRSAPRRASTPRPVRSPRPGWPYPACGRASAACSGSSPRCGRPGHSAQRGREQSGAVRFADSGGNPGATRRYSSGPVGSGPAPSAPARA